ncbi:MAG: RidA family protein [Pirellulaceae bacterium]|nr:RidA family protein [Pirellulaceae bacterium]
MSADLQLIVPPGTRPPAGHYSPAVVHAGLVYVAGQLPIDPVTGDHETGSIAAQTTRVLRNLEIILDAAGSSLERVLQVTVYTSDVSQWSEINRVYAEFFGAHRPARAVVPTTPLHYGFLIEIAATAALK